MQTRDTAGQSRDAHSMAQQQYRTPARDHWLSPQRLIALSGLSGVYKKHKDGTMKKNTND